MNERRPWIIVLAGGEGTRLAPLTRALYGADVPKQFAVLAGARSLLQETLERAVALAPPERIIVVTGAAHEARAREQLAGYPGVELLVQPRNLDTGPGLLLPLALIHGRDPAGRVVILPADHHVPRPAPLRAALEAAATGSLRRHIVLVGVVPDEPETEYGWILRGAVVGGRGGPRAWSVRRFHEKPTAATAARLRARGALWNTFIMAGPVAAFWSLARAHLPRQAALLSGIPDYHDRQALAAVYAAMAPANFSSDVLARARDLLVLPIAGSGWTDWGTPRRVFQSLDGTADLEHLLDRIAAHAPHERARAALHAARAVTERSMRAAALHALVAA